MSKKNRGRSASTTHPLAHGSFHSFTRNRGYRTVMRGRAFIISDETDDRKNSRVVAEFHGFSEADALSLPAIEVAYVVKDVVARTQELSTRGVASVRAIVRKDAQGQITLSYKVYPNDGAPVVFPLDGKGAPIVDAHHSTWAGIRRELSFTVMTATRGKDGEDGADRPLAGRDVRKSVNILKDKFAS